MGDTENLVMARTLSFSLDKESCNILLTTVSQRLEIEPPGEIRERLTQIRKRLLKMWLLHSTGESPFTKIPIPDIPDLPDREPKACGRLG